jgi:catalase
MLDREYPPGTVVRRDAHPKHHGLVAASFVVDDVPEDLRHGVFAAPHRYEAWVRFSNGSPRVQPDRKRDQRGLAIKLLGVRGEKMLADERDAQTQDFVLASAPRFFIRDADSYVTFARAAARRPAFRMFGYFFGVNPFAWRLHEFGALAASLGHTNDLLATRYWSQVPSRLGPHVVKYSVRPVGDVAPAKPSRSPDFLREALIAHLASRPARFEFLVQRQRDPSAMPIEDATIEWSERDAPFERVATLEIPAQRFDMPDRMALAEQLSYTPWHTLPAHEPLGSINRMRRIVYETLSAHRHARNGVPRREPTTLAIDPVLITPQSELS